MQALWRTSYLREHDYPNEPNLRANRNELLVHPLFGFRRLTCHLTTSFKRVLSAKLDTLVIFHGETSRWIEISLEASCAGGRAQWTTMKVTIGVCFSFFSTFGCAVWSVLQNTSKHNRLECLRKQNIVTLGPGCCFLFDLASKVRRRLLFLEPLVQFQCLLHPVCPRCGNNSDSRQQKSIGTLHDSMLIVPL